MNLRLPNTQNSPKRQSVKAGSFAPAKTKSPAPGPKKDALAHMKLRQGTVLQQTVTRTAVKKPTSPGSKSGRSQSAPKSTQQGENQNSLWAQPEGQAQVTPRPKRKLKFKHFTSRNAQAPVENKAKATPKELNKKAASDNVQKQLQARSDLDLGFQHLLRGNAPTVLSNATSQFAPKTDKDKKQEYTLTSRFSAEIEEANGGVNPFATGNGNSGAGMLSGKTRTQQNPGTGKNGSFADSSHNGKELARIELTWSKAGQSVEDLGPVMPEPLGKNQRPSFVSEAGASTYTESGCNCVASFLGLTS